VRVTSFRGVVVLAALVPFVLTAASAGAHDPAGRAAATTALAAAAAPAEVFVGAGDIGDCSVQTDEATANLLDAIPGTVYTLGDNAYGSGTAAQFANCYGPSWGRHKSRTRPSPGNHDYGTAGAAGYFGYFGDLAGPAGRGYYSYDLGGWHIVSLNSEIAHDAGSAQIAWLTSDLAATTSVCTLAYWHRPRFSSGKHGNSTSLQSFWDVLYAADADVVLVGHDHNYERFAPQSPSGALDTDRGLRQFVVGTGGRYLRTIGVLKPNSEARSFDTHGVLKLTLHATSYDWEFVPVAGKTFTDVGSDTCHGLPPGPGDTIPPEAPTDLAAGAASPTQVDLSWTAASDDVGVTGYEIYRNRTLLTTVGAVTTFSDRSVAAGTAYDYALKARDAAGNVSSFSNTATVTTPTPPPQPSGITFVAVSSGSAADSRTLVLSKPAGTGAGNLLLAGLSVRGNPTVTAPAGWALVRSDADGCCTARQAVYWKLAGANEPASYTFTFSAPKSAAGGIVAYAGVNPITPIDAHSGRANAASTSVTAPSLTTSAPGAMLVFFGGTRPTATFTPPPGMQERWDRAAGGSFPTSTEAADQLLTSAGASGTRVARATSSNTSIGQLVALRP
jgi:Calcineurin-like phosphoesterase